MSIKYGYIFKKSKLKLTSLNIVFNMGSIYEKPGMRGISHLMEHLITKAIDPYENRLLNDCIEFNAYTTTSHIVVYFNGLETKLTAELKKELTHAILNNFNNITEEQFNTEKSIVLQEIMDTFEDPGEGNFVNLVYKNYNITCPAGIPDEVANFTFKEAKQLAKKYYTKPARIIDVASKPNDLGKIKYNEIVETSAKIKFKPSKQIIKEVITGDKINFYGFSKRIINKKDYPYLAIGLSMLSDGLSSPFYQEIREKRGLSYFVSLDTVLFGKEGIMSMTACTTEDKKEELVKVVTDMNNDIIKYLTLDRFNIIINLLKTKQEIEKCLPYKNVGKLIFQENAQIPTNLNKITYNKVVEITQKYFGKNLILTLI